jgi:glycerol-3-phosphate acyltransferase PlsX
MASAIFNLGRIEGVSRPAIAMNFPTSNNKPCLILDVGANSNCRADNLLEFAHMGSIYFNHVVNVPNPRVALLSIGEEASKGNDLTVEAHRRLSSSSLNFIGNIEGRDVLRGKSDVVVCDGFVGNILLKFAESIRGYLFGKMKRQISSNLFSRFGAILMGPFLRRMNRTFDYSEYGGAPLLGTNGVTIVCHGSSNASAVMNAIRVAREAVVKEINKHINDQLSSIRSSVST